MKTEKELKKRLLDVQRSKATAKCSGTDESYRVWCKAEKLLNWVLEE